MNHPETGRQEALDNWNATTSKTGWDDEGVVSPASVVVPVRRLTCPLGSPTWWSGLLDQADGVVVGVPDFRCGAQLVGSPG